MSSNAFDIQIPATEIQISEAIRVADAESADTIRRLAFERDRLKGELDPPVCRLQFPDGSVPGNAREAAEVWKRLYDDLEKMLAKTEAARLESHLSVEAMRAEAQLAEQKRDLIADCIREIRGDVDDATLVERLCEIQGFLRNGSMPTFEPENYSPDLTTNNPYDHNPHP